MARSQGDHLALQSKKAVTAYLKSEQLLPFGFALLTASLGGISHACFDSDHIASYVSLYLIILPWLAKGVSATLLQ